MEDFYERYYILFDSGTSSERKSSTNFKRCIMYLDLLENYEKYEKSH